MKTNPKRLLSMLLVLMMVLTLLPTMAFAVPGDVAINETNFPDDNFQSYVSEFDTDYNGILTAAEIAVVNRIYVHDYNITTLRCGVFHGAGGAGLRV